MWSQSTGPSSTDISARNSLVTRPRNLDTQVTLVPALRSSMDQKIHSPEAVANRVRFRGLPRSRTTTGIAAVSDRGYRGFRHEIGIFEQLSRLLLL